MAQNLPLALRPLVPVVALGVARQAKRGRALGQPIARLGFPRLGAYFSPVTLSSARLVACAELPHPPIPTLAIRGLTDFVHGTYACLTLEDAIFVERGAAVDEGVIFHELVYVVQWRELGRLGFIERYGRELLEHGYVRAPLEAKAYELEERFRSGAEPFDAEAEVRAALAARRERPHLRVVQGGAA